MKDAQIRDQSDLDAQVDGPVTMLNRFTAKEGQLDAFVEAQIAEYRRLRGKVPGWLGNRLVKALDGGHVVNIAVFASMAEYCAWRDSDLFADHLDRIRPFVVEAAPTLYTELYAATVDD